MCTTSTRHVRRQSTLAREHVSTQGTLSLEQVSTQNTLAREHVSMQGTLAHKQPRHVSKFLARRGRNLFKKLLSASFGIHFIKMLNLTLSILKIVKGKVI